MTALLKRLSLFRSVPQHVIVLTAVASYGGQVLAGLQGWPLWAIVLATLVPWIPLLTVEMAWTYRHYQWLALFYVLVVTQGGHFLEHLTQMVQIHILGLKGPEAKGIFGALDTEWVHFTWNTWVLAAVIVLLLKFRSNPWLWATLVLAGWHEIEHAYIMFFYLRDGLQGNAGLLAENGAIAGGLGLARPDLHFLYNLAETLPLVVAFVYQLRNSYNEWLPKALPHLSREVMVETTNRLETRRVKAGEIVLRQGAASDRFYIVADGEVEVYREGEPDGEVVLATLGPGQFFGEMGLLQSAPRTASVRAKSDAELLALDRAAFQEVVRHSEETAVDLHHVVEERLGTS